MKEYLKFAEKTAEKAGKIMLRYFKMGVEEREKEDLSIVTDADEKINRMVIEEVNKRFPEWSVLGEEEDSDKRSEYVWVCDPVDGTVPFSKGIPVSVFSLALVKNGVPLLGVVYDPFNKRMFSGAKGQGAFLNKRPIKVSDKNLNHKATLNIEWWPEASFDVDSACHKLSVDTGVYVLHLGCVINACCMVAAGQYEACVFAGSKKKSVDIAAVKVIVEEAGGVVTDLFGEDQRYDGDIRGAIVSNGLIHKDIESCLKGFI